MPSTSVNGKLCYVEIPALDVARSAAFYQDVFGWNVRTNNQGHLAFDDATGEVSGSWITGRLPSSKPGLLIYVTVDSVAAALDAAIAAGGELVQPIGGDAPEVTARVLDPGGNVIGLYQAPGSA